MVPGILQHEAAQRPGHRADELGDRFGTARKGWVVPDEHTHLVPGHIHCNEHSEERGDERHFGGAPNQGDLS